MTRTVVTIPWRPQPARLAGHRYVRAWLARHLPAAPVLEVDTHHRPYNLAAVRNEAVRQATSTGADVVVIIDADAVPATPDQLHAAIAAAAVDGGLHLPFTEQRYLTAGETEALLTHGIEPPRAGSHGNGACYAVTPATWAAFGGQDERFSGWGGDDDQLVAAATALASVARHPGVLWSLWHADERRPVGTPEHRPNARLAGRYWAAKDDPSAMRDLIAER